MLNALSIGCAGFAVLDVWKPYSRAAAVASIILLVSRPARGRQRRAWLLSTLSMLLLVSEEILSSANKRGTQPASLLTLPAWLRRHVARHQSPQSGVSVGPDGFQGELKEEDYQSYVFSVKGIK